MTVQVTHTDQAPAPVASGYAYEGNVTVEVNADTRHRHPRRYARFIGPTVAVRPYRAAQRQDIHYPHPAPVPVQTDWECVCGQEFVTPQGLMLHMYEIPHPAGERHYPL